MNLFLHEIFKVVKSDFCDLIDCRLRGDTIEIITAIPTITSSYVSVFISKQGDTFNVSDGGWISRNLYEGQELDDSDTLKRITNQYKEYFKIKELKLNESNIFYYKKTNQLKLVSALVYDVGHFVSAVVNTQNVIFKEVDDDKVVFHNTMNTFLRSRFDQSKIELNHPVKITEKQNIRFNAIVHANARDHYYVMYVTGSRNSFFIKDLTQATVNFEILNEQAIKKEYFKKVAVINLAAPGYDSDKSDIYIERLGRALERPPVLIRTKNDTFKLAEAIPVGN